MQPRCCPQGGRHHGSAATKPVSEICGWLLMAVPKGLMLNCTHLIRVWVSKPEINRKEGEKFFLLAFTISVPSMAHILRVHLAVPSLFQEKEQGGVSVSSPPHTLKNVVDGVVTNLVVFRRTIDGAFKVRLFLDVLVVFFCQTLIED